jgi:hypothetical protein
MRSLRITIGLAAAACVFAICAAPTFAAAKEKLFFGEFTASIAGKTISEAEPAVTKGHGEVSEFRLGPWEITCESELKSKGKVTAERSESFFTELSFKGCTTNQKVGKGGVEETKKLKFSKGIDFEFHANGSANVGKSESEVKILNPTSVTVKAAGDKCKLVIPAQTIPIQAEKNPEKEFESAEYGTETESVEKSQLKKFPSGIRERLNIFMEFKKILTEVPVEPGKCIYSKEPEGKFNPETKTVEFTNGVLEAELEEIEVKGGELGFDPTPPVV